MPGGLSYVFHVSRGFTRLFLLLGRVHRPKDNGEVRAFGTWRGEEKSERLCEMGGSLG